MSEVYVDDPDASVSYSGTWQFATDSLRDYHNTVHFTNTINSKATFTFTGINVMAYGDVRASETPQSSYSIDGGSPTIFKGAAGVLTEPGTLFYTSPSLSNGQHTLTITNLNDTNTLFIDYFIVVTTGTASASTSSSQIVVTPSGTTQTSSKSISSASVSASVSASQSNGTSTISSSSTVGNPVLVGTSASSGDVPDSTNTSVLDSATARNNSHQRAAVIGALAALVILALFIAISLWLRHRRRKRELDSWENSTPVDTLANPPVTDIYSLLTYTPGVTNTTLSASTQPPIADHPATTSQVADRRSRPPNYPMSEPPPYEVVDEASTPAQSSDAQQVDRMAGLKGVRVER